MPGVVPLVLNSRGGESLEAILQDLSSALENYGIPKSKLRCEKRIKEVQMETTLSRSPLWMGGKEPSEKAELVYQERSETKTRHA